MRARVDGKQKTAASIVWSFEAGGLRVRCLALDEGFLVQARSEKGWTEFIGRGRDAFALLKLIVGSGTAKKAVEGQL